MTRLFSISPFFAGLHSDAEGWLSTQDFLEAVRGELPEVHAEACRIVDSIPSAETDPDAVFRDLFGPVSDTVFEALGERLRFSESWPSGLTEVHYYWLQTILTFAQRGIAIFAPSPDDPLKPTIVPFPAVDFRTVAFWFSTEWWLVTGGAWHARETMKKA